MSLIRADGGRLVAVETGSLAERIKLARRELRLSTAEAAALARVSKNTWSSWELRKTQPQSRHWAGIDTALRWKPGTVAEIVLGAPAPGLDVPQPDDLSSAEREVWDELADQPVQVRWVMVQQMRIMSERIGGEAAQRDTWMLVAKLRGWAAERRAA